MPILDGVLGMLEETAADWQSIHEVLGNDVAAFCDNLVMVVVRSSNAMRGG